jgi:hypothetical protein
MPAAANTAPDPAPIIPLAPSTTIFAIDLIAVPLPWMAQQLLYPR